MNKLFTLLTVVGFTTTTITAQTSIINMQKRLADKNKINETVDTKKQNTPLVLKEAAVTTTLTFNAFSGSANTYGLLSSAAKPLQYNDNINTVSFIQRKSDTYIGQPADNTGVIVAMISNNWGTSWDSTCIYSSATDPGRYPQGGIYNPVGNTNIANAIAVGCGPAINSGNWSGCFYASKQLATPGSTLYNNTASSVTNAMQLFSNSLSSYPANQGKQDFSQFGFTSTDDGVVRSLAQIAKDINLSQTDLRGAQVVKGSFNAGVFNWTTDSLIPPVVIQPTSLEKQMSSNFYQAWNEAGTIGYVVFIGTKTGAVNSNLGWQPIVYKTTNSGTTWALISSIDFNNASYQCLLSHLDPVSTNSNLRIPFFNVYEGLDCTVDINGKLHIATTIASTASNNLDSLANVTGHGTENYTWNHSPGRRPYLYDFVGDGSSAWTYFVVDSLGSEAPSSVAGGPGFADNPWGDITSDSRIQLSCTPNGQYITYTWAESDSNITNGSKKWNNLPNIKARLYDATAAKLSSTEINVTKPIAGNGTNNPNVSNRAMLHFTSSKSSTASVTGTAVDLIVPITVCNSNPYSSLTNNVHYFSAAKLTYSISTFATPQTAACLFIPVGVKENTSTGLNFEIMPNPASGSCNISLNTLQSNLVNISVLDLLGKTVLHQTETTFSGDNVIALNINTLNKGVYFVTVKQGGVVSTKKMIVN